MYIYVYVCPRSQVNWVSIVRLSSILGCLPKATIGTRTVTILNLQEGVTMCGPHQKTGTGAGAGGHVRRCLVTGNSGETVNSIHKSQVVEVDLERWAQPEWNRKQEWELLWVRATKRVTWLWCFQSKIVCTFVGSIEMTLEETIFQKFHLILKLQFSSFTTHQRNVGSVSHKNGVR
jgi:hypothetical protein